MNVAPPQPITAKRLRGIIAGLGDRYKEMMPSDDELTRRAVVFTAYQYRHLHRDQGLKPLGFPMHVTDVLRNEYIIEAPLLPPGVSLPDEHPLGHPRYDTWRDFAQALADEFHGMMGRTFNKRGATARFLAQLIRLITGETPSVKAIGQWLVQPKKRNRPRERVY